MKGFVLAAAAAVTGTLLISACGGGGDSAAPPGSESAGPTSGAGDDQVVDLSNISFVDNLLTKVDSGEWTLGEGLVATLKHFAGEVDEEDVLRHPDLLRRDGTGIFAMANEYLENGEDAAAKSEIERLLGVLTFSDEQLKAMAGISPSAGLPGRLSVGPSTQQETDCTSFFYNYNPTPPGVGPCLEASSATIDGKTYRVFYPLPLPAAGWSEEDVSLVVEAIKETVPVYSGLGKMPAANIVFSVSATPGGAAATPVAGKPCGVFMYTDMQTYVPSEFKQYLAHELAHCFQTETFPEQNQVEYKYRKWREEGLADYLSNVVYPSADREWGEPPEYRSALISLALFELNTTLLERAYTNFIFFQYLANIMGDSGVMDLVRKLPVSGDLGDQEGALANYPGMDELYHDFARAMTDGEVIDASGVPIPYDAPYKVAEITTAASPLLSPSVRPFAVSRYHFLVSGSNQAELDFQVRGLSRDSSRPPDEIEWSSIPTTLPYLECIPETIVLVTNTEPDGGFTLNVPDVVRVEGQGDLVGEWTVDHDSIRPKLEYLIPAQALDYSSGEIRATFRDDGKVEVVYDGFEVSGHGSVNLTEGSFHSEYDSSYTSTTSASGVDGYRVANDYIFFDSTFAEDFLEGTNTVHSTKKGIYFQVEEADTTIPIDESNTETETEITGWALFGAATQFDLQCNGTILRFLSSGEPYATFNRTGPAE